MKLEESRGNGLNEHCKQFQDSKRDLSEIVWMKLEESRWGNGLNEHCKQISFLIQQNINKWCSAKTNTIVLGHPHQLYLSPSTKITCNANTKLLKLVRAKAITKLSASQKHHEMKLISEQNCALQLSFHMPDQSNHHHQITECKDH
jgi:hypothetical protein